MFISQMIVAFKFVRKNDEKWFWYENTLKTQTRGSFW